MILASTWEMIFSADDLVEDYLVFATMVWFVVMYVLVAFWHPAHYRLRPQRPSKRRSGPARPPTLGQRHRGSEGVAWCNHPS